MCCCIGEEDPLVISEVGQVGESLPSGRCSPNCSAVDVHEAREGHRAGILCQECDAVVTALVLFHLVGTGDRHQVGDPAAVGHRDRRSAYLTAFDLERRPTQGGPAEGVVIDIAVRIADQVVVTAWQHDMGAVMLE